MRGGCLRVVRRYKSTLRKVQKRSTMHVFAENPSSPLQEAGCVSSHCSTWRDILMYEKAQPAERHPRCDNDTLWDTITANAIGRHRQERSPSR